MYVYYHLSLNIMLHHVPYIHYADDGYNVALAPGK